MFNLSKTLIYGFAATIITQTAFAQDVNSCIYATDPAAACGASVENQQPPFAADYPGKKLDQQTRGKLYTRYTDSLSGGMQVRTFEKDGSLTYSTQPGKGELKGAFNAGTRGAQTTKAVMDKNIGQGKAPKISVVLAGRKVDFYANFDVKSVDIKTGDTIYVANDGKGGQIKVSVAPNGSVTIETTKKPVDPAFVKKIVDEITEGAGFGRELNTLVGNFPRPGNPETNSLVPDHTYNDDKNMSEKRSEKAKQPHEPNKNPPEIK
ncbi:MAG: hypothetical protein K1X44_07100 [Alphaproteobacteria bacterium]|nr:hypothetical protein [Alphaproteobacteria bacterium]